MIILRPLQKLKVAKASLALGATKVRFFDLHVPDNPSFPHRGPCRGFEDYVTT